MAQFLIRYGAQREEVPAGLPPFIVGGVDQRSFLSLHYRGDGVQILRRNRPDYGQHLVLFDEFMHPIDSNMRARAIVCINHLQRAPQDSAFGIYLLRSEIDAQLGLFSVQLDTARKRQQSSDSR